MSEFERCIKRGSLKPFTGAGIDVVSRELSAAQADLADAEKLLELGMDKRTTITAYYAMFHAARAAVMMRGYCGGEGMSARYERLPAMLRRSGQAVL